MRVHLSILLAMTIGAGISAPVVSQQTTPNEFENLVNFQGSIESLALLVQNQQYDSIDAKRYYVLEGEVASTQVLDPNPDTFQAIVELVTSRWVGLERIEAYHLIALVEGPEYAARLPERIPRDAGPEIIQPNQRLLVVGPFIGTTMLDDNLEVPVVEAVALR